ncbi:coiled-coil domain-containing protein 201 [Paroedura picta]|uniref:coiled-coil domain-containing protein 201 n=1 Tax=Paroedura picta TaxID=143630 RepID=UPI004056B570
MTQHDTAEVEHQAVTTSWDYKKNKKCTSANGHLSLTRLVSSLKPQSLSSERLTTNIPNEVLVGSCVTEMPEDEEECLNIKRSWKRARVKHSTPTEISMLTLLGLSPEPQRTSRKAHFFEGQSPQSKRHSSRHLLKRSPSVLSHPSQEFSSGTQLTFPTRQLSTITGSEESPETLHKTVLFPKTSGGRMRDSEKSQRKSPEVVMEQEAKRWERPASRVSRVKTKKHLRKQLMERRVRAWELRQLINVEEAVSHKLTIEDVRAWT